MDKKPAFILALLITLLIASNVFLFSYLDKSKRTTVTITRVIDGDTLEIEDGTIIRLNNINTPEKGERGYQQAKDFLIQYENQTIEIIVKGLDKYKRTLAKIYVPEYLNLEIVRKGLAKKFLVNTNELKKFADAEMQAIENQQGLWKRSQHFNCFQSTVFPQEEIILLKNICSPINIHDWGIQDEGRKNYNFKNITIGEVNIHTSDGEDNETDLFWKSNEDIWNNDRDTFYLFDSNHNLAHYHSYGY